MNPYEYIAVMARSGHTSSESINFLVSGVDTRVQAFFLDEIIDRCRTSESMLVLVDDAGFINTALADVIPSSGYSVRNLLSGEFCLYDPFSLGSLYGMTYLRQLVEAMGFDEAKKLKAFSYLNFIMYLDRLVSGGSSLNISKLINEYGSTTAIMMKVKDLSNCGVIDEDQATYLLSKYSETSQIAPELENIVFTLSPFINSENERFCACPSSALVLPLYELEGDDSLKIALLQLLRFGLKDVHPSQYHILIMDKGCGTRKPLAGFVEKTADRSVTLFSKDIFSIGDENVLTMIQNRFTARVYARHASESSCAALEKALGVTEIIKHSYTSHYDRRFAANKPLDVLFGKNKSESYAQLAPVYEPRYRKEMIASLPNGAAIVEYHGNSSIVSCC